MKQKPTYDELVQRIAELEAGTATNGSRDSGPELNATNVGVSKEMLQLVMDNIPQFIFWKDRNSVFLGCNQNFALAAGVDSPEAIRGKTDHDLAWKKEEADFFIACDKRVMENDAPEYHILEPQLQAGGHQAWLDTNKIPLHDSQGDVVGILGTYEDITERKKNQETLRLYEKIISTTRDLMSIIDPDYVYLAVNDALLEAWDKRRDEVVGSTVADLVGADAFEQLSRPNLEKAFSGREVSFDTWVDYPEYGRRYMHVTYYPYFDKEKRCTAVVSNAKDITRIKKLERKLIQSQKMEAIGTLAGGIAHDFNNILSGIIGYTQLAQHHSTDHQKIQRYLNALGQANTRAAALVKQILAISRQSESRKVPTDISSVIHEAMQLLRASIPATVEINVNISANINVVEADPTQIHQIVMNLCTNAYHALEDDGGRIDVGLETIILRASDLVSYQDIAPGKYIRLTVADSGNGIAPDDLNRIFDPYFTTKEVGKGTGLGLATVHGIVKDHRGDIKVYSEPGGGTTFLVLLPIIEELKEQAAPSTDTLVGGHETILFVDDEKALVDIGKDILEDLGYRVETRTSPHNALKAFKAKSQKYDLVITDFTMPGMTGDKLALEMKNIRDDIPIILCTGFSNKMAHVNALEMGMQKILMKPLNLVDLATSIRMVLDDPGISVRGS